MNFDRNAPSKNALLTQIGLALGQVRAEYTPDETIFSTFSWPVYWGELVGVRPCVLMGGRGTGKTTALRGLAYGGQASLRGPDLSAWDTIGAYWRVDSMVVSAFAGRGQTDEQWTPAFSHYVNLKLVSLFLQFCEWYRSSAGDTATVTGEALYLTATSLNVPPPGSLDDLSKDVRRALATLEARLNGSTADLFSMRFSALGRPLAYLLEGLAESGPLRRLPFTFCVDEFENFRPYQQRVINTLIKHVGDSNYTFKIGIRDSEQRDRETLAMGQPLLDPADYTIVDIVSHLKDQSFVSFASMVCESRLEKTDLSGLRMTNVFPGLSLDAEARLLGAERERSQLRQTIVSAGASDSDLSYFDGMALTSACMVGYWSQAQKNHPLDVLREAAANERAWEQRVGNHSYAMLFTLRQGVRGIKKYYAGWSTYCQLANGNIRLLLELVYEGLRAQISETGSVNDGVSYGNQTSAASDVGRTTLRELQGQSGSGGQLTRLTLSMGRIFNVFAATPEGHAPEVNQIRIDTAGSTRSADLNELLQEAVANGCLVSFPGDKQERVSSQTKSLDYQLHPIFSAYFIYSHRRKRRIQLRADEVVALSEEGANRAIDLILKDRRRDTPDLPEQLEFYAGFYEPTD